MFRCALVAMLAAAVSNSALADQTYDFNFTGDVTDVSGNIVNDTYGNTYNLAPPPYGPFSGVASFTEDGTGQVSSFRLYAISRSTDSFSVSVDHFVGFNAHATLLDPSNPGGGIEGLIYPSYDPSGTSYANFHSQINLTGYDFVERFDFSLTPGAPGEGDLDLTIFHPSILVGDRRYFVTIFLTSVTPVPEPSSLLLTTLGLGALALPLASRARNGRRPRNS